MGLVDPTLASGIDDAAAKNTQKQLEAAAGLQAETKGGETVITSGTTPKVETTAGGEGVSVGGAPVESTTSAPITTNEQPPAEGAPAPEEKKATPTSTLHTPQE